MLLRWHQVSFDSIPVHHCLEVQVWQWIGQSLLNFLQPLYRPRSVSHLNDSSSRLENSKSLTSKEILQQKTIFAVRPSSSSPACAYMAHGKIQPHSVANYWFDDATIVGHIITLIAMDIAGDYNDVGIQQRAWLSKHFTDHIHFVVSSKTL